MTGGAGPNERPVTGTGLTSGPPGASYGTDLLDQLFRESLDSGYALPTVQRSRGRRVFLRILTAVTALIVGFLFAVAYEKVVAEKPQRQKARDGLISDIHTRQQRVDTLTAQAEQERNQVTSLQEALLSNSTLEKLRTYEAATGLRKVTGDGVVVTLSDGPPTVDPVTGQKETPSDSRVLYFDLRTVVNELFADGAEAVSINGQRLTALSTIRAAGEAILVDFKPLIGPYKVSAIGPGSMADDFNGSATAELYRKLSSTKGMGFSVKQTDGLTLPAAASPQLYYATPLTTASPSPSGGSPSPSPSRGGK